MCKGCLKCSKPYQERSAIAEHFCCGSTLPLLTNLIKSEIVFPSFIRSYSVSHQQKCSAMLFSLGDSLVSLFNGISTIVGYLMPKPFS